MSIGKTMIRWSLVMLLSAGLAMPALATGNGNAQKIVGSWEAISTLDPTGEQAPGLFTFNKEKTWISSGDSPLFSNGHGAWKRTGARTYSATNKAFILAETGGVSLVLTNQTELEVSPNGNTFTATFSTEVSLPDGTVVDAFTGTSTGIRIKVD